MSHLPEHLKRYVVEQDYSKYTAIDHAVWRFILRQLKAYLGQHAHESYVEGLEKTGIEIEKIPKISDISQKLSQFGWTAVPVSGFIPPAAFMELQSLSILPIASDIRSLDHLLYTPAPDIVHEAAGHAPILANPEFADYLKKYAQVAKKAIISKEDLELYKAIRSLSDLKENADSTGEQIRAAEFELQKISKGISHISEAAELARMNWWTAEYGLIGPLDNPKIFGAGLLSSVGEARLCLNPKVKKIPLTVDCISYGYDITEPQPQLFVTPSFGHLTEVLEAFSQTMAFRTGGLKGLSKAIQSEAVTSVELDSGVQISGQLVEALTDADGQVSYLRLQGPCQLAYRDQEISGHGRTYHSQGFGTPVGFFKKFPQTALHLLTPTQWKALGVTFTIGENINLEFTSGLKIQGEFEEHWSPQGHPLLLSLTNATAELKGRILFEPSWGVYDLALGSGVVSVFGGAADRWAYGEADDFVAARVPAPRFSDEDLKHHELYKTLREIREKKNSGQALQETLAKMMATAQTEFADDWLLILEIHELALLRCPHSSLLTDTQNELRRICQKFPQKAPIIQDGLNLAAET